VLALERGPQLWDRELERDTSVLLLQAAMARGCPPREGEAKRIRISPVVTRAEPPETQPPILVTEAFGPNPSQVECQGWNVAVVDPPLATSSTMKFADGLTPHEGGIRKVLGDEVRDGILDVISDEFAAAEVTVIQGLEEERNQIRLPRFFRPESHS